MSKLFSAASEKEEPVSLKEELIGILTFLLALAITVSVATGAWRYAFGTDASPFLVTGSSMYPTLTDRQMVVVNNTQKTPSRGDVIVTLLPEAGYRFTTSKEVQHIVKRVLAGPGETVEIGPDDVVLVNGIPLEEPYLTEAAKSETYAQNYPVYCELSEGEYFVVGDNRAHSCDSRYFGAVTDEEIIGIVNENTFDSSFIPTTAPIILVGAILLLLLTEYVLRFLLRKALKV